MVRRTRSAKQRNPRTDRQADSRRLDVLRRSTSTVYLAGTVCRRVSEIPVEAAVVGTVSAGTVRNVANPRQVHKNVCDLTLCDCRRFSVDVLCGIPVKLDVLSESVFLGQSRGTQNYLLQRSEVLQEQTFSTKTMTTTSEENSEMNN